MLGYNKRELRKIKKKTKRILAQANKYSNYSKDEIIELVEKWKNSDINLDKILVDAFTLCREITTRVLAKSQYRVQLVGGIVLSQGRIAEMRTGEGKTLTELCPAFLNALTNKGVHILTVNDYLCERDFNEMKEVFEYAGLTVGLVVNTSSAKERKDAYACDITYTTNTEVGFDYLRDNTALTRENQVLRGLNYVIIDELDSILIDEARTPLILAQEVSVNNQMYQTVTNNLKNLIDSDVEHDLKENYVILTDEGVKHVEELLKLKNFSWVENSELRHVIYQCLKAKYLFRRDKEYIVDNGEVVLVDINTGRIAEGRKLSDGLHQAIEAKEGVAITYDTETTASITYQNFFKLYHKVSGMSGTIATNRMEMQEFYNLDVVVIPTNKPIIRNDEDDIMCLNKIEKYKRIIGDIVESKENGIPVLVGTASIKESEKLSALLKERNIEHKLLNAKTKSEEAEIISRAGQKGSITIATNIAGRGTDIKISEEINKIGGLRVIATQRNIAKRIDNQLIGRSGRQGSKGSSIFYLSPNDELFKEHAPEKVLEKFEKMKGIKRLKYLKKNIYKAQKLAELAEYESRKDVLKRDYVIDMQRQVIYKQRQEVIDLEYDINRVFANYIYEEICDIVVGYDEINKINYVIDKTFNGDFKVPKMVEDLSEKEVQDYYSTEVINFYNEIASKFPVEIGGNIRQVLLYIMDREWIAHVERMELLKKESNYRSLMQVDPFLYYRKEAGKLFENLLLSIRSKFLHEMFYNILNQIK
ncbi:MAG: DEAD/DEAH box helicase [Sarcina sp.]